MKYSACALAMLVAATITSAAMAADGTIKFEGELTAETCRASLSGGDNESTVKLPTLATSALANRGAVAGLTAFSISLKECSDTPRAAAAFFQAGGTVDPVSGNLKNSGTATEVQLQLVDATNGQAIKAGSGQQSTSTSRITTAGSTLVELPYAVQYYAKGATGPGTVVSSVTYNIDYK
ncbi:fimbrial protein [Pseudomonas chlororaphis]